MRDKPKFGIIQGGKMHAFALGPFQIIPSPRREPPFPVTATVFEEDTWRVLSADPAGHPEKEHPVKLMTNMLFDQQAEPGSVLIQGDRWLTIIHDLDTEPTCKEEWIRIALHSAIRTAEERNCTTLALPLLGSVHGCIQWKASLELILDVLTDSRRPGMPAIKIWLQVPSEHLGRTVERLGEITQDTINS
ncbi:hypothetical protein [Solemya velesiana gill symbiont]|uniref:Macro domain-containing protein n=1 Tax=Solemya velesiana gill symbiont TaxID=1918948 RepID=A0A1T2KSG0_9GAMM|nr:hypothetical protein [Solemya velesiana gill symbiont]OOZ35794.1 hypothetical protein BOW51_10325 [Solemya velesiana gill symbiont]